MPCNSEHMEPTMIEHALSDVYCVLDEIEGVSIVHNWRKGYHPRAYGKSNRAKLDLATKVVCTLLQGRDDIVDFSLELQIWWRDHQRADKARVERELRDALERDELETALAKLTSYERDLIKGKMK